jgi:hypothetical protein
MHVDSRNPPTCLSTGHGKRMLSWFAAVAAFFLADGPRAFVVLANFLSVRVTVRGSFGVNFAETIEWCFDPLDLMSL